MKDAVRILKKQDIKLIDVDVAHEAWFAHRLKHGYTTMRPLMSTETDNLKLGKSANKLGIHTLGLSLAHASTSGEFNVCRYSTPGCRAGCVADAGNGQYHKVKNARVSKTLFLMKNPSAFYTIITHEIDEGVKKYGRIAVRLNVFSDIPHEDFAPWLFTRWGKKVDFMDYSKWPVDSRPLVEGYDITRSASELTSNKRIRAMLAAGERVAVCFDWPKGVTPPDTYLGYPVVDGDLHDARFTEPKGVVVMLRPKGSARKSGFVRPHIA